MGIALIGKIVRLITALVVGVIVLGIILVVLKANPSNTIVKAVTDTARFLVGPFKNLFTLSNPRWGTALNWGIAALVYAIVGGIVAGLFERAGAGAAGGGARGGMLRRRAAR